MRYPSYLGWRWTAWITMIMAATAGLIGLFVLPETYAPVLLQRKAARLRLETKNWALHANLYAICARPTSPLF